MFFVKFGILRITGFFFLRYAYFTYKCYNIGDVENFFSSNLYIFSIFMFSSISLNLFDVVLVP